MTRFKTLHIESTEFTPEIILNVDGNYRIAGVSRPEDVSKFYDVPFQWLLDFKSEVLSHPENKYKHAHVHLVFELKYFNSASAKHILKILDTIRSFEGMGLEVQIDWFYEEADEQLFEDGQDLSDAIEIPFHFIKMR